MGEDLSNLALGDMIVALGEELEQRVSLGADRQVVLVALAVAANNGRMIGATEIVAQAVQQGVDLDLRLADGPQAPSTLSDALGE
jgi:hypothetical protein